MTARDHNKLLSIFYFVSGGLQLLLGVGMGLIYAGVGTALLAGGRREEDQFAGGIMLVAAVGVGFLISLFGIFTLFSAYSVLKMKSYGRVLAIIISILSLFSFPIGTALGVYGLWFFFGEGKALYAGNSGTWTQPAAPAPDSWR
jgi:hypothetical protein